MHMFYTKYEELCKAKGVSPSKAADEMNINRASVTQWKNTPDIVPSGAILLKVSKYFNVSVDYLLGNETKETPAADSDEILMFALYGGDNKDITPGMLEDVRNFAQYIREKRKGENK